MATLKQGSTGSEVRELQTLLNNNGANLSVDGKFGPKTQAAVTSYQKANGLTVDGIVGKNTWGALRGTTSSTRAATETTPAATGVTQETGPTATTQTSSTSSSTSISGVPADTMAQLQNMEYTPSQNVLDAYNKLQEQAGTKPSPYVSQWSDQLEDLYNQIVSRGKEGFDYDLNGDSLWQQYKDQYVNLGRRAMEDTMGNAASLTGGYGNSYASTAGNQAYQQYLTQLTNMIPELEGRAYERWRDQGEDLYNQYGLVADRENQDYARHRDDISDWWNDRNYLTDYYNNERNFDYGTFGDKYNRIMALANMENQDYYSNLSAELAQRAQDLNERELEWRMSQAESSSGGGGGGGRRYSAGGGGGGSDGNSLGTGILDAAREIAGKTQYKSPTTKVLNNAVTQWQVARSENEFDQWLNEQADQAYPYDKDLQDKYFVEVKKHAIKTAGDRFQ